MKRKSDIVREAVAAGNFKEALRIAKGFRINITAEQRDTMCRAYECIVHPDFTGSSGRTSRQPSAPALKSSLRFTDKEIRDGQGVLLHQAERQP